MPNLRNIGAIAGKELRGYFGSPVAWVMLGLFAVVFGWFFNVYLNFFVRSAMQAQFGAPAPTNLKVPPYTLVSETTLVIGEDEKNKGA